MGTIEEKITEIFSQSARVKAAFLEGHRTKLADTARLMAESLARGGKILLFGNGGSATDASHIAAELVNRFRIERRGLPAIALATDMAVVTSIANDYSFDEIFSRQIESLGASGDIAVAITTSGASRNIWRGIETARGKSMRTILLSGEKGKDLAELVDMALLVPSADTPRIQECHITIGHALCALVEDLLFPRGD